MPAPALLLKKLRMGRERGDCDILSYPRRGAGKEGEGGSLSDIAGRINNLYLQRCQRAGSSDMCSPVMIWANKFQQSWTWSGWPINRFPGNHHLG